MLEIVEGEVLGTRFINELLGLVDRGGAESAGHLEADRDRLRREIDNLMDLVASGVPADTVAPKIRERQAALAKVEAKLRTPRPEHPNVEMLRAALEQRAEAWKADLRAEPKVARLVLRRLVGPILLHHEPAPEWLLRWEAPAKPEALLDGLVQLIRPQRGLCLSGQRRSLEKFKLSAPEGRPRIRRIPFDNERSGLPQL